MRSRVVRRRASLSRSPEARPMKQVHQLTAIIEREGEGYVALSPELDIASQGNTIEEARDNLVEALDLVFETADPAEIRDRLADISA
jgi:predicted RNase H-like HicB family nuclease